MNGRSDIDEQIDIQLGDLLRSELPVPEHAEGHRERVAALLTAEAVARAGRRRWFLGFRGHSETAAKPGAPEAMRRVAPVRPRRRRLAVYAAVAAVVVIVAAIGSVEVLQNLAKPQVVLRITDRPLVEGVANAPSEVVATSIVSLEETKTLIRNLARAIDEGDPAKVEKFYAPNGWLENDADKTAIQGSTGIAEHWRKVHESLGLRIELEGDPIPYDRYVAQRVKYVLADGGQTKTGIQVYQIDAYGQVAHQWVMGWVE
jgi:hypothetical protein